MKTKAYPLRIPENLIELAEIRSREERIDKSTALRQLMYAGAEDYVLKLIRDGRLSISKAAELLDKSVYGIYKLAEKAGLEIGSTLEQYEKGKKTSP